MGLRWDKDPPPIVGYETVRYLFQIIVNKCYSLYVSLIMIDMPVSITYVMTPSGNCWTYCHSTTQVGVCKWSVIHPFPQPRMILLKFIIKGKLVIDMPKTCKTYSERKLFEHTPGTSVGPGIRD